MKTLAGMWTSAAVLLALAASTAAQDAQVMVFSTRNDLLHESTGYNGGSFSSAGLAQLAMDALGLPTATKHAADTSKPPTTAFSPVQADVFAHADGYALVLAEDCGAPVAVDAALSRLDETEAYHKLFPMRSSSSGKVVERLTGIFRDAGELYCAGSAVRCADVMQMPSAGESVDPDADAAFSRELARVARLADAMQARKAGGRALYVVALPDPSALHEDKREQARVAAAEQVAQFLAALQTAHPLAGAQVVAVQHCPKALDGVVEVGRKLDTTDDSEEDEEDEDENEEDEESEEDEEEEEELELEAEDGSNATTAGNSSASSPLTAQDIAEYQIVLWTSVVLVVALLMGVVAMANMDVGRDSLLYAKFTTSAGHRKAD